MSTSFYWVDNPCLLCHHGTRMHVGTLSDDGFLFRGWIRNSPIPEVTPSTFEEWRQIFMTRRGVLEDEYGDKVDFPLAWIDSLVKKPREPGALHCDRYDVSGHKFLDSDFA